MSTLPLPIGDYDPSRVVLTIGDIEPKAYGPDSRITISPSGDRYSTMVGQDGHVMRVRNRAITHTCTFTLMRTDPANDKLWGLLQADLDGINADGIVKLQLTDNNGSEKLSAPHAWVTREPDLAYSAAGDTRTWTVAIANGAPQVGSLTLK